VLLPHDLENYEGTYIISPGRPGIPASLPSWSQADEKKILDSLILELNDRLLAGVDPDPNLSRSSKRPQLYPAFRSGCVESAAFVGGSNAKNLANAAANLGIDSYQLAKGGWKITRDNIEKTDTGSKGAHDQPSGWHSNYSVLPRQFELPGRL
jgi:hypothetical protein